MRWIVFSDKPVQEEIDALDNFAWAMPGAKPFIVRTTAPSDVFRRTVLHVAELPRPDGLFEQTILFTDANHRFVRKFNVATAYNILKQDPQVLGVRLTGLPKQSSGQPDNLNQESSLQNENLISPWLHDGYIEHGKVISQTWFRSAVQGGPADAFRLGTIYRTTDILGPLTRTQWESLPAIQAVMNADPSFDRRPKTAVLTQPVLEYQA